MKYRVIGGKSLSGKVRISGNKNSVFPCVAAALLTQKEVILENIPSLNDTRILIQILQKIGVKISLTKSQLKIHASEIKSTSLSQDLMSKLRGSMVLVGALLGRSGKVNFYHPGGDIIGQRSISVHLDGFKALGATLKRDDLSFFLNFFKKPDKDCEIFYMRHQLQLVKI